MLSYFLFRRTCVFKVLKAKNLRLCSSFAFPDIDLDYYCDINNSVEIKDNIDIRKGIGDINRVLDTYKMLSSTPTTDVSYKTLKESLYRELSTLPNKTHPLVKDYKEDPHLVQEINEKRDFGDHKPLEFSEITRRLNLMRTDKLGQTCGHKSYYFLGELAELEEALIKYTVMHLLSKKFQLVSVPDILPSNVLRSCGMAVNNDRTQIYSLDPIHHGPDLYLSGTAEMSLAGLLMNTVHNINDLPLKLAAVSRCYRAETSSVIEERGIYRCLRDTHFNHCFHPLKNGIFQIPLIMMNTEICVFHEAGACLGCLLISSQVRQYKLCLSIVHQFTKVEMFTVTTPNQSEDMLECLRSIEEELFSPLGFHMRVLDMPPHELGAPAYRKYDIEAWMPGRNSYGEVSSCSNCTDYQSRRLHIKYTDGSAHRYVHTLNGTACAIPRMLIALLETHQNPKGKILIPKILQPFMNGKQYISRNTSVPELKLLKIKK